ncbi:MAG: D-3-phosphoglycerate dehydrogenase [Candidatus Marinamargulisbacteria bacterium]|jgi:D-3-phosphoglycerate dehydrogenase
MEENVLVRDISSGNDSLESNSEFNLRIYNKIAIENHEKDGMQFWASDEVANPDAILVRSEKLHEIQFPGRLRAIGRAGAGVNNIPVGRCTENGIVVFNTPGANANAVKELVIAGLLLSARNILKGIDYVREISDKGDQIPGLVEKSKSRFKGYEISGKKLGVVGLGAIGVYVANDMASLGLEVEGYDPFISVDRAWGLSRDVKPSQNIAQLLGSSHFVSIHVPLTDGTKGFVNSELLKNVKKGAILLNFSRPEVVDQDAVLEALDDGRIAEYITDFPSEKLVKHPGVTCIPHLGASTKEAEENCATMILKQIQDFLINGNIENSVNFPACSLPRMGRNRLTITNRNIPNMVSQMTSILGEEGINIVEMLNKSRKDLAYNIVDFTGDLSDSCFERIRSIDGVIRARIITAAS